MGDRYVRGCDVILLRRGAVIAVGIATAPGTAGVSMMGGMASMMIPKPEVRQAVTHCLGIVAKIAPVVRKVDFYKSTASYTTFDGRAWHTLSVTHYVSPKDRVVEREP